MKRFFFLAAVLALVSACSTESDKTPRGQYDRGMKHVERSEFNQAESAFVQLQRADSSSSLGDLGLAQTYEEKLWWLDALCHYLIVAEKQPDLAPAVGGATRCFYNLGAYYDASRSAQQWITLAPHESQPYYLQALALIKIMNLGEAEKRLKNAEEYGLDKGAARLIEARILWLRGQFDASLATATQGIGSGSKSLEYFDALSDYYADRGIADSAVWAANEGYRAQPTALSAWRLLEVSDKFNAFGAARKMIRDWAERNREVSLANLLRFRYALGAGDKSQASILADKFQETAPIAYTTMYYSAMAYRIIYNELLSADFLDQAINVASSSRSESFNEFLGAYIGYSYCLSYNRDAAARQLQAIKGWRTETTEFQAAIYTQMTISGGRTLADQMFDSLKPTHGDNPVWLTAISNAYLEAIGVPFSMGRRFYELALEKAPSYRPAFVGFVKMAVATGEYQEALSAFDRFKQIGPSSPELDFLKAQALVRVGRIDEGITLFKQTFSLNPQSVDAAQGLMFALSAKRLPERISELAQFCLATAKDNPDIYEIAARLLLDWGFANEGLEAAQSGLKIEADYAKLRAQEARGLYATKKTDEALRLFEDILAKDQAQGESIFYYSLVLAETGADTLRADLMAQRALALVSPDLFPAKNLTRVYLAMRRYTQGREACLRAAVVAPEDPEVWYLMGICQFNEKLPEAKENLQKALSLGLSGDDLFKAQEALRQL